MLRTLWNTYLIEKFTNKRKHKKRKILRHKNTGTGMSFNKENSNKFNFRSFNNLQIFDKSYDSEVYLKKIRNTFDIANISVQKPVTPCANEAVQMEYSNEFSRMLHNNSGVIRTTPTSEKKARHMFHVINKLSRQNGLRDSINYKI